MQSEREKLEKQYMSDDTTPASDDSRKKQKEYGFSSDGHRYRAHTFCVFNDSDFQEDVTELRKRLEGLYYPKVSLETSLYDKHLLPQDKELIKQVADKYLINLDDLGFYADGYFQLGYTNFGKIPSVDGGFKYIMPEEDEERPVYVIGTHTTLEDIRRDWPYIKEMRNLSYFKTNEERRKRTPENPTLIYTVFKARLGGVTYPQIFRLYSEGKLKGYSGSQSQFSHEESLERYYKKYEPKPQANYIAPLG